MASDIIRPIFNRFFFLKFKVNRYILSPNTRLKICYHKLFLNFHILSFDNLLIKYSQDIQINLFLIYYTNSILKYHN